jgi:hypothetical protein
MAKKLVANAFEVIEKVWSDKYRCWLTKSDAYFEDGVWKNRNIEKEIGLIWNDYK